MKHRMLFNRSLIAGLTLGGGLALALGFGAAFAQDGAKAAGKPAVIATVRLSDVLEKLDQVADAKAVFASKRSQITQQDQARQNEIKQMQDRLQELYKGNGDNPPTREMIDLQESAAFKTLQYQNWSRITSERLDIDRATQWEVLYRTIKQGASAIAAANGYDLVLVDDSGGEVTYSEDSRVPREQQVMSQIAGRRMLFANPMLDITDQLITRMNNAHKAAGAAGAGGAGAAGSNPAAAPGSGSAAAPTNKP